MVRENSHMKMEIPTMANGLMTRDMAKATTIMPNWTGRELHSGKMTQSWILLQMQMSANQLGN